MLPGFRAPFRLESFQIPRCRTVLARNATIRRRSIRRMRCSPQPRWPSIPSALKGSSLTPSYTAGDDSRLTQQQMSQPQQQAQERNANHAAMDLIAKDTGGAAFYGTNGLTDAMDHVAAHGSNFYTLTYTTTNPAADGSSGRFKCSWPARAATNSTIAVATTQTPRRASRQRPPIRPPNRLSTRWLHSFPPVCRNRRQIPFTVHVTRRNAPPKTTPASTPAKPVAGVPGQGGDNPNLQGPLTRYSADLMIPAKGLQFDMASDSHRHVSVEAALVVYDRQRKPLNWMLRQINLNLDAARYALAQANGVNFFLEIDAPQDGTSLRGGVYDLNASLAGTLEIPLSAIVTPATTTSSK